MGKSNQSTNFDKIQRALFSDPDSSDAKLTKEQERIRFKYSKAFTYWVNNPSFSDRQIVRFMQNECNVSYAQAYRDLKFIKLMLGNVSNMSKEWMLYTVIEMCKDAFKLAKMRKDPKGMAIAADKIGKYCKLDKNELDALDWDQLMTPNFEPSPDISILGFKPDPNIEERRRKMREKYLKQYDPNAISDAEIVED